MSAEQRPETSQRSDARRNRARILDAARELVTAPSTDSPSDGPASAELSMAEVARRAGVGRATLYRNFPERRDLLEALFAEEVDALIAAAVPSSGGDDAGAALLGWLHRFAAFADSKHAIAGELLEYTSPADPVFAGSRQRVIAAGEPLLAAAQRAGHIRDDVTLVQALDLVLAVVRLDRDHGQVEAILRVALDGLRARQR